MKIFELQQGLTSYKYPIIKLLISIGIVLVCVFRRSLFNITTQWLDVCVSIIATALCIAALLCIEISCGELYQVYINKRKRK